MQPLTSGNGSGRIRKWGRETFRKSFRKSGIRPVKIKKTCPSNQEMDVPESGNRCLLSGNRLPNREIACGLDQEIYPGSRRHARPGFTLTSPSRTGIELLGILPSRQGYRKREAPESRNAWSQFLTHSRLMTPLGPRQRGERVRKCGRETSRRYLRSSGNPSRHKIRKSQLAKIRKSVRNP